MKNPARVLLALSILVALTGMFASSAAAQAPPASGGYDRVTGACRGNGWNANGWPKGQGYQTPTECQARCNSMAECTAYDLARQKGDTFDCYLFATPVVEPASDPTAICYRKAHSVPGYRFLQGSCRGDGWNGNGWPKHQGYQSADGCKSLCDKTGGCTSFDLARPKGDQFDCYLFGHRKVVGTGGPDRCFQKYVEMKGACRGKGWNTGGWPKGQGYLTQSACRARCDATTGCTSFDLARPKGNQFDCYLFGHQGVIGAPDPTAVCHTLAPGYVEMQGACRGDGWNTGGWPKNQGYQTRDGCQARCNATTGCTSYDLARPKGNQFDCYLFGHNAVIGAPDPTAVCYSSRPK